MAPEAAITLQLNSIDELFTAPAAHPFSSRAVDILGEAGLVVAQKQVLQQWPRLPRAVHLTVELPAGQITPDLAQDAPTAAQRYFAHKIEDNRLRRQVTIQRSLRQLVGAGVGILLALAFIALLLASPLGWLPAFLRGVLIVLALYACSVLSFDAVWSLVFDWAPTCRRTGCTVCWRPARSESSRRHRLLNDVEHPTKTAPAPILVRELFCFTTETLYASRNSPSTTSSSLPGGGGGGGAWPSSGCW